MSADMNEVFQDDDFDRQRQQIESDYHQALIGLGIFFAKAEHGMITLHDVEEAKENLKLFGVNVA